VFATAIHFHPSLIFAGKIWAYQGGATYGTIIYWKIPSLAPKHEHKVEVNGSGEHSSI
jgi:hypothetical protein